MPDNPQKKSPTKEKSGIDEKVAALADGIDEKLLGDVSGRLLLAMAYLVGLLLLLVIGIFVFPEVMGAAGPMVFVVGALAGFVSIQRRIGSLKARELRMMEKSWMYICLSPFVGGILALLLYSIFVSGLLSGDLFPEFWAEGETRDGEPTPEPSDKEGSLAILFTAQTDFAGYGKLLVWSFIAGFSESFVTNVISGLEGAGQRTDESNRPAGK